MKKFLKPLITLAVFAALCLPAYAADPTSGTLYWNQGPSLGQSWSAVPVLGYPAGGTSGTIGLANGAASGKTITLGNPSATAANYELDLPAAAPTAGQILSASGTNGTAGTWLGLTGTGNVVLSASPTFTGTIVGASETLSGTLGVTGALTATGGVDGVLGGVTPAAITGTTLNLSSTATLTGNLVASTGTFDVSPAYSGTALGNPIVKVVYGSCSVAAVNAGTCTILTGVASRIIEITNFDIVAAGSAATCTGVLLEDTNGTPVVAATLAAATLTSGSHNVPLAATLGVGFGAGSGLTSGSSLQLKVNGSGCTTTTAFQYMVSYAIH